MAGKGSKQRPTDKKKFEANFDRIFGEKKDERETRYQRRNRRHHGAMD